MDGETGQGIGQADDGEAVLLQHLPGAFGTGVEHVAEQFRCPFAGQTETRHFIAGIGQRDLRAQDEHAQALERGLEDVGGQHQVVHPLAQEDLEDGQHAPLGVAVAGELGLAVADGVDVVAELVLQKLAGILALDGDEAIVGQIGDHRSAGGGLTLGRGIAEVDHPPGLDAGALFLEKSLPLVVHACSCGNGFGYTCQRPDNGRMVVGIEKGTGLFSGTEREPRL